MGRVITFLSDYGHDDDFVGMCHGVIARIAPETRIIDITHGIPRHGIVQAAVTLRNALHFMPAGIHLAVVDPEVGANRRALALQLADDRVLVGPDNGLLTLAVEDGGGVRVAVDVARSPFRLEPVSATFHGRDLFAPVAARLATGASVGEAGERLDPDELEPLALPAPMLACAEVVAHVLSVDRFGNATLNVAHHQLADSLLHMGGALCVEVGGCSQPARFARTFADVEPGELLLYEDASRALALAVNRGSAAEHLSLTVGGELRLRPA